MNLVNLPFLLLFLSSMLFYSCGEKTSKKLIDSSPKQEQRIGFYNLENIFDTDDDPDNRGDNEWLPESPKKWTPLRYQQKLGRMAQIILELDPKNYGPAVLGVCEIENKKVLQDLINQPLLSKSEYGIVHYDSDDYRGIDVGMIYQKDKFTPIASKKLKVKLPLEPDGSQYTTRDVLLVNGNLKGQPIYVFVNHWPSRRGGAAASNPKRAAAAKVVRYAVDSIMAENNDARILIMGDFNDDPVNESISKVLNVANKRIDAKKSGLYNPTTSLYKQGIGTLGYHDSWNLFDQIIVSDPLANATSGWRFHQYEIYRKPKLLVSKGRYKGYPLRTYVGNDYKSGYSDHLPVYVILRNE